MRNSERRPFLQHGITSVLASILITGFWPALLGQPTVFLPQVLTSPRPVAELKTRLAERYGRVITYEEPFWVWGGETKAMGQSTALLVPKPLTFVMPGQVGPEPDLAAVLDRALAAYHLQTTGPHFRVLISRWGLHIVPAEVRSSLGNLEPAQNPLDSPISVSNEERTASGHVLAINAAITKAVRVPLRYGMMDAGLFDKQFAAEPGRFSWGIANIAARDALVDLLERSATTFSWEFRCQAAVQPTDRFCGLFLSPMVVLITSEDGSSDKKPILFDRCGKCPPLLEDR